MSRACIALAALGAGLIWALPSSGSSGAEGATCATDRGAATITVPAGGAVTLGVAADGRILVDGEPCAAATVHATNEIRVVGGSGSESVEVDAGRGSFGGTAVTVRLGGAADVVRASGHRGRGLRLGGGGGADSLTGGLGRDRIDGGAGNDRCEGGPERDRLISCTPEFEARASAIEGDVRRRMTGRSWRDGCPVPLAQLRLVELRHWDFRRDVRSGELVVHEDSVGDITRSMRKVFARGFPIRRMRLVDEYGADDRRSMRADNTSAFNCRFIAGRPGVWSQHAFGRAIDVNPVENPYVSGGSASPRSGRRFADRSRDAKGMIHDGDHVVRSFRSVGWEWGGDWSSARDYQHFSANGR
ncbi:MAG: M15 family metallopeptidase [Solirubrobacterales bacterium]